MLEHVAANQTRFAVPGIRPDARGIALGPFCVVLLPSIDRVVGLFRGLSEAQSLDELLGGMKIVQVRTPLESQEFLVFLPVSNSYAADAIDAIAALIGGVTFTGSERHFVKYRNSRSPMGYDLDNLSRADGDFLLYAPEFEQAYRLERKIPFAQLALRLSVSRTRHDQAEEGESLLLRLPVGLWRQVLAYLHRYGIAAEVAATQSVSHQNTNVRIFLLRTRALPLRMARLFSETPGIQIYRSVVERAAVEVGYRHPFELTAVASIFAPNRYYLYGGTVDRLEVVDTPRFVSASALVEITAGAPIQVEAMSSMEPANFDVPVRMVQGGSKHRVVARWISADELPRLKKLAHWLPPQALAGYTICSTGHGVFVFCEVGLDYLPLGEMFYPLSPNILVSYGWELLPRIRWEVMHQQLKVQGSDLIFFSQKSANPLRIDRSHFQPLGRAAVAHLRAEDMVITTVADQPLATGNTLALSLRNEPLGRFPLWGFSDDEG